MTSAIIHLLSNEVLFSIISFVNAWLFICQIIKIYHTKSATSISLITFVGFLLIEFLVLLYGVAHQSIALVMGCLFGLIGCGIIIFLSIFYQKNDRASILEKIIAIMPGNVYWVDRNNVYQGCNDNMARLSGLCSRKDIIGKRNAELPWNMQVIGLAEKLDQANRDVMVNGKAIIIEEPATLADGKQLIYLSNKVPIQNTSGAVIGMVGISTDITLLNAVQQELIQSRQTVAEVANEAKSEFLRNMEHQLRTPFSGIYSLVQLMAETEGDPEKKLMLEETYKSAKELLDLLNNIIEFSREHVNTTAVLVKKFDLKALIEKAMTMELVGAHIKKLELTFSYPEMPTIFIGDPYRIRRIILNLLGNAIKFTEKGRVDIDVKLAKQVDEKHLVVQLIVSDTGIGIPLDKQQLIYEKFYRISPANHNKYAGAGLGLYTVKELVSDLNGEIEVVSSPQKGTRFICTLPLERPLVDEINDGE